MRAVGATIALQRSGNERRAERRSENTRMSRGVERLRQFREAEIELAREQERTQLNLALDRIRDLESAEPKAVREALHELRVAAHNTKGAVDAETGAITNVT